MATGSIDVRVENQLVRFVCPTPLDHDRVISEAVAAGKTRDRSRYNYDVLLGKGRTFLALNQNDKALQQYDEILTFVSTDKQSLLYASIALMNTMLRNSLTKSTKMSLVR